MVFRFLLARPRRLRVDADRALVSLNGCEIARERGAYASLWGPVNCAFLFPISLPLLSLSIGFGVSFGYYCTTYRFIVRRLILFSSLL